jgi:hypothetical protein
MYLWSARALLTSPKAYETVRSLIPVYGTDVDCVELVQDVQFDERTYGRCTYVAKLRFAGPNRSKVVRNILVFLDRFWDEDNESHTTDLNNYYGLQLSIVDITAPNVVPPMEQDAF